MLNTNYVMVAHELPKFGFAALGVLKSGPMQV